MLSRVHQCFDVKPLGFTYSLVYFLYMGEYIFTLSFGFIFLEIFVYLILGAELFAKRRKRSEKWVVSETNGGRQTPLNENQQPSTPLTPLLSPLPPLSNLPTPSYLPETAQRIQHKEKLDEIQVSWQDF